MNSLTDWSKKWLLAFNLDKCSVLNLGKNNLYYNYYMKDGEKTIILNKSTCEKDLEVHNDRDLTFDIHIKNVYSRD